MNRRKFLQDSALFASALAATSAMKPLVAAEEPKAQDKNSELRVACMGVHGQGFSHVSAFAGRSNCVVAAICDVDEAVIGRAMEHCAKNQKVKPDYTKDIRKVLDDKSIDIISIATPNHWHALAAIWAMQAGKDVYVEKPVSHNVWEGRQIDRARVSAP